MKIFPTLNIQNAQAVPVDGLDQRSADPMEVVAFLLEQNCQRLTLVDVDAARGVGHNRDLLGRLMARFAKGAGRACIQVGGGIRSSDQAQYFLDNGATWLLVGTILHRSPLVMEQLVARFREHLTAGLDARGGQLQTAGWKEPASLEPEALGERLRTHGFRRVLFMDIPAGPGAQPDFETARRIACSSRASVLMGGSIRSLEHLNRAMEQPGLQGVGLDAMLLREDPALAAFLTLSRT